MTSADPLERAILEGRLTGQANNQAPADDPHASEPIRNDSEIDTSNINNNNQEQRPTSFVPPSNAPSTNNNHGTARTGPKGVLADYAASHNNNNNNNNDHIINNSQLDLGSDDDDQVRQWRENRLRELQSSAERELNSRENSSSSSSTSSWFGHLREIGIEQFEQAVLQEPQNVPVVLHLYEPYLQACSVLDTHLSALARKFPHTKFLRARASVLDFCVDIADAVLPTILVYRAGDLAHRFVAVDRRWSRRLDVSQNHVTALLARYNLIEAEEPSVNPPLEDSDDDEDND